jgi:hypothetical protein
MKRAGNEPITRFLPSFYCLTQVTDSRLNHRSFKGYQTPYLYYIRRPRFSGRAQQMALPLCLVHYNS